MPALGIACDGTSYSPSMTMITMQHCCPQRQPGYPLPVVYPTAEESSDDSGSESEEEEPPAAATTEEEEEEEQ